MVKSLLKAPPPWGQFLFTWTVSSQLQKKKKKKKKKNEKKNKKKTACIFFMLKDLVYSNQLNLKVKYQWQYEPGYKKI